MFKHLLIATDGSPVGYKAVQQGLEAARAFNAKVTIIKVTEMWSALDVAGRDALSKIETYEKGAADAAAVTLAKAKETADKAGVPCETIHVPDQGPAEGIVHTAEAKGCDMIVMGSHGRKGISRVLIGSQAQKVLSMTNKTVMVCR